MTLQVSRLDSIFLWKSNNTKSGLLKGFEISKYGRKVKLYSKFRVFNPMRIFIVLSGNVVRHYSTVKKMCDILVQFWPSILFTTLGIKHESSNKADSVVCAKLYCDPQVQTNIIFSLTQLTSMYIIKSIWNHCWILITLNACIIQKILN